MSGKRIQNSDLRVSSCMAQPIAMAHQETFMPQSLPPVKSAEGLAEQAQASRPSLTAALRAASRRWVDTTSAPANASSSPRVQSHRVDWLRAVPFIAMHVACISVWWVGSSPVALAVAAGLYALRMFALTGFYHRYFSHRTFQTSRTVQFVFAVIGASSAQRGP